MTKTKWYSKLVNLAIIFSLVLSFGVIPSFINPGETLGQSLSDDVMVFNTTSHLVASCDNITGALDTPSITAGWTIKVADSYNSSNEPAWPIDVDVEGVTITTNSTPTIDPGAAGQGALMISANNVTIDGDGEDGMIIIGGTQAYTAGNPQEHTIWVAANYSTIRDCKIINDRGNQACIYIGGRTAGVPSAGATAVYGYQVSQPKGHTIENNTFRIKNSGEGWGIFAYDLTDDCSINDNRFVGDAADVGAWAADEGAPGTGIIIHKASKGGGTNAVVVENNTAQYVKYTWLTFYAAYMYNDSVGQGYEHPEDSTVEDVVVRGNTVQDCRTAVNFANASKTIAPYGTTGLADLTIGGVVIGPDNSFHDNDDGVSVNEPKERSGSYACVKDPQNIQITQNNIYDNTPLVCGVDNGAGAGVAHQVNGGTVDAEENWWGDENGPTTSYVDTGGDTVTSDVDFIPWLDAAYSGGSAVGSKEGLVTNGSLDAKTECDTEVVVTGTANVTAAEYPSNPPDPANTFTGDIGKYIDVQVEDSSGVTQLEVRMYYTEAEVAGVDETTLGLRSWNGTAWVACSDTGVNTVNVGIYGGYIWAKIRGDTTPTLAQMEGTPFGGGGTNVAELTVEIIEPESGDQFYVCQNFTLTFNITNTGTCEATYVTGTVYPSRCEVGSLGDGASWTSPVVASLAVNETMTVNTTMHCTQVGVSSIHVIPGGWDVCNEMQIPSRFLHSDIVGFEQVFPVTCEVEPNPTKSGYNTTFTATVGTDATWPLSYNWTFGDGEWESGSISSHTITVYHTYNVSSAQNFTATCTVTDGSVSPVTVTCPGVLVEVYPELGVNCWLRSGFVELGDPARNMTKTDQTVCFNATRVGGFEPGIDCSEGGTVSYDWLWDFGDGSTNSTDQNPCHNYTTAGNYTAIVTLTDDCLGNEASCNVTIEVYDELRLSCNVTPLNTKASDDERDIVTFNATIIGGLPTPPATYTWNWDFGDGSANFTGPNTTHQYTSGGNWTAVVTVWDNTAINNTATCNKTIHVYDALNVTCDVTPDPQNVCHAVNFTAERDGGVPGNSYNWTWEFSDNTTAVGQNVTKTFMCVGNYTGTVTVTDEDLGNTANCTAEVEIIIVPPVLGVPDNNETVLNRWVTFNWTDIGCVNYTLEVWQKDGSQAKVLLVDTGKDTTWSGWIMDGDAYNWTVTATDMCGISATSECSYFLVQDSYLDVSVDAPTTGDSFAGGSTTTIIWSTTRDDARASGFGATGDEVIKVALSYSTNSGTAWTPIATNQDATGSLAWTVPTENSANCLIKAVATDGYDNVGVGISGLFSIVTADTTDPVVEVTSPIGTESYLGGSSQTITWTASDAGVGGVTSVDLYVSSNGGVDWAVVALEEDNDGTYAWTVPAINSVQCLVKAVAFDAAGNSASDMSNSVFTITTAAPDVNAPVVTVTRPNGGETFTGGSQEFILWNATDDVSAQVDIDINLYYKVGTGSWILIAAGEENDGEFKWTLPEINNTQCLVLVDAFDGAGNLGFDVSDNEFTISTGVSVSVDAPSAVKTGSNFTVNVDISEVTDFDAAGFEVVFDSGVLDILSVTNGLVDSTVIPVIFTNNISAGRTRILLNVSGTPGVDGAGYLCQITFNAIGAAGTSSDIELENGILSDNSGFAIGAGWTDDSVAVLSSILGDANGDSVLNALDITSIEMMVGGLLTPTAAADANQDGKWNALDVTLIEILVAGA